MRLCSVEGCDRKHFGNGYCHRHHDHIRLYGKILERTRSDPNEFVVDGDICWIVLYNVKNIEIARAKIDAKYYEIIRTSELKWYLSSGYVATNLFDENGKQQLGYLHQAIFQLSGKEIKDGEEIDHKDGDKLNCLEDNLRVCSSTQNKQNRKKLNNNTSGDTGVYWHKQNKRWIAQITVNKEHIYLGSFITKEEAIKAYNDAAIKYFGEFAVLNENESGGICLSLTI